MEKPLVIGLVGFGNIGAGVVRHLDGNREIMESRLPRALQLKAIADKDTSTRRDAPYDHEALKGDWKQITNDPDIDVVVELVGGTTIALEIVRTALQSGKHVVTANKALLAVHGPELLAIAQEKQVGLLFEAAVGGGIPIIRTLQQGLCANRIESIAGIVNGTCNYILTQMTEQGLSFDVALKEAMQKGYAEPDPTYDIEGYDTAHKIAILASLAFGMDIHFDDVWTQGITSLEPVDIQYAREMGYAVKLLGITRREVGDSAVQVRVHPTLIPLSSPLGKVNGVFNGLLVDGHPIGQTMYYGRGAGADATSSAVISDLMALACDTDAFNPWHEMRLLARREEKCIKHMDELETNYYVRFTMLDKPGAMATIGRALADRGVSIRSMIQHESAEAAQKPATISIVTHRAREHAVQKAIAQVEKDGMCADKSFILRVEE